MEHNETITRLAKPLRKGILRVLLSRVIIIVILLLFEFLLLVNLLDYLTIVIPHSKILRYLFIFLMIFHLFNSPMDSSGKLTWMFMIMLMPLTASVLLAYSQLGIGHRRMSRKIKEQISTTQKAIEKPNYVMKLLKNDGSGTADLSTYLNRSGCFPIYDQCDVTYFPLGEKKFACMLEELQKAETFIFMEYFIIEEGYMWGKILDILIEKAKAGVDVRVMYDGLCEISQLPPHYDRMLKVQGINAKRFAPLAASLSTHYNYRDHRKILVIDGKVAFNGGVNLADEYINKVERFGHWKDTAVCIRGQAVRSFTLLFLQMWNYNEPHPVYEPYINAPYVVPEHTSGYVMPYGDCPLDNDKVGETVYIDMLFRATHYVHIMTPYLVLDDELSTALKFAAQRGIDVQLILPGIPDKKTAYALAKSHYKGLLDAGVKIYEYTPGFVHAKVFVSDDIKAVVGTINLDYRSLYHHYECATYMYKTDCIADIAHDFLATRALCEEVTKETVKKERLTLKLFAGMMKLIAPLI